MLPSRLWVQFGMSCPQYMDYDRAAGEPVAGWGGDVFQRCAMTKQALR